MLDGCVARLQDHRQTLRHVADDAARGAEVEQHGLVAAGQQDHVVRRDVAVKATLRVDHHQGFRQRAQQFQQPFFVRCLRHRTDGLLEGDSLVERHGHVGCAVGLPESIHLHERRMVEGREQPGFIDKAVQPEIECVPQPLRAGLHLRRPQPRGQRRGHVFLQRDRALERMVQRKVDDAESALAQATGDLEFAQTRADSQGERIFAVDGGPGGRRRDHLRRRRAGGPQWADGGAVIVVFLAHAPECRGHGQDATTIAPVQLSPLKFAGKTAWIT